MSAIIIAAPGPVFIDPNQNAVHENATITSDGYGIYQGIGVKEVSLIVNVKASPTGVTPTIQFTIEEVDPGDLTTVFGVSTSTSVITGITIETITLVTTVGGAIKVSWALTGLLPSFTEVYVTLTSKAAPADRTVAAGPYSNRLSDGSAFYTAAKTGQLPAALVGGRLDTNLGSWLGSTVPTVGQKISANSIPVVIASDQSSISVTGTFDSASVGINNTAAPTSSTQIGGSDGTNLQASRIFDLDTGAGTEYDLGVSIRLPASGGSVAGGTSTNPIRIDPTGTTTQPVSGTVTSNQGTANSLANAWTVKLTDGTNGPAAIKAASMAPVVTDPALVVAISPNSSISVSSDGYATSSAPSYTDGTFNFLSLTTAGALRVDGSAVTQPVSATSLPLPTGAATSANQTTLGSQTTKINDGTNTAAVTVSNALKVDGSAVTQPVSGTVTANIGTTNGLALDATLTGGTQKAIVRGGAKGATTPADITSTAEGADHQALDIQIYHGGSAKDPTQIRALTSSDTVTAVQGTAAALAGYWPVRVTDGTNTMPTGDAVGRALFHKITDGTNTATVTGASALKVDGSAVTQPISGTVTANIGTTNGLALDATLTGGTQTTRITDGTNTASVSVSNALKVDGSAVTQPVSGTVTSNQGTANSLANAWATKLTDGTNGPAAIKAASVAPVATDPALVVAISPNSSIVTNADGYVTSSAPTYTDGTFNYLSLNTSGGLRVDGSGVTQPVSGTVTANQGGTWTVQPGNTANTTPWLMTINQGGNSATVTGSNALKVDGSAVTQPVSGTVTANIGTSGSLALDATLTGGTQKAIVRSGAKGATTAADVTSTAEGADHQSLDVQIYHGGSAKDPTQIRALTSADVVTSVQGTAAALAGAWPVKVTDGTNTLPTMDVVGRAGFQKITDGTNTAAVTGASALKVDGSAVTQPVSGTVTANIGTSGALALDATLTGGTARTKITDGTNNAAVKAASTPAVATDPALVVTLSPNNSVTTSPIADNTPATQNVTTQDTNSTTTTGANNQTIITGTPTANSAASFSLASLETAQVEVTGTWTGTLQVEVSPDGGTTWYIRRLHQVGTDIVSASFTANFSGGSNVGGYTNFRVRATAAMTGTATVKIVESLNANVVYIGNAQRITDNSGNYMPTMDTAGRAGFQKITDGVNTASVTAASALKVDGSAVTQPVSAATLPLPTGAATAANQTTLGNQTTKINDGTNTAAVSAANALKVDGSAVTQPVSGTVTANIGTTGGLALDATLTGGTAKAIVRGGAKGATTAADVTSTAEGADHQSLDVQIYHGGAAKDPTQIRALTSADVVTAVQGTAAALAGAWPVKVTDGTNTMPTMDVAARAGFQKITDGTNTASVSAASALKVDGSAVTQPVSGTVTANIGTSGALALDATLTGGTARTKITDGTNNAAVKAASTAPVATDPALVVAISPNSSITTTPTSDSAPATQNVTAQDTNSSTTTGANNQSIITGTPTANSAASFSLSSWETAQVQVTGTWTGTLQVEASSDGGTTWYIRRLHQAGTDNISASFTANFAGGVNVGGYTNIRVRATAAMTGTATVAVRESLNNNMIHITNALRVTDNSGNYLPAADVAGRKLFAAITDGTNTASVTASSALKVDGSAVTQPVSGTVTANIGTSGSLALDATLTGGTTKAIVRGGAKGATAAADVTSTAEGADHQSLDVQIYHGGTAKDPTAIRALTSSDVVTAAQGTAAALSGYWPVRVTDGTNTMPTMDVVGRAGFQKITDGTNTMPTMDVVGRAGFQKITDGTNTMPTMDVAARKGFQAITDGTNTAAVKAASTSAAATDTALVVAVSPNIGVTGRLPVTLGDPGTEDVFGSVIMASRLPQITIPFFQAAPSVLMTITTSGGGSTAQGTGTGTFTSGTAVTAQAKGVSFGNVFYGAHNEVYVAMTASFTTPTSAATYQRIGLYDAVNGFAFGYNGLTFGVWQRYNSVDTFTAQASWNTDVLSGAAGSKFTSNGAPVALTQTNLNLYRIRFGWLGIANIFFEVLAPDGNYVIVHVARLPNTQTTVSVTNPNLPITIDVSKTSADATSLVVTSGCCVAGVSSGDSSPYLAGVGTITTNGASVQIPTMGHSALSFGITGTWTGTLAFQFSVDGTNWQSDTIYNATDGTFVSSITTNKTFQAAIGGYRQFRVTATSFASGTATISYSCGTGMNFMSTQALISDGAGHGPAAVKAASTLPAATDPALVVAISPNSSTSTTPAQSSVAGSASNVTLLASNTARKGATIFNDSSSVLFVKLGVTASSTSYTVRMLSNAYYEVPFGYTGEIDGIWVSATGNARITEVT